MLQQEADSTEHRGPRCLLDALLSSGSKQKESVFPLSILGQRQQNPSFSKGPGLPDPKVTLQYSYWRSRVLSGCSGCQLHSNNVQQMRSGAAGLQDGLDTDQASIAGQERGELAQSYEDTIWQQYR